MLRVVLCLCLVAFSSASVASIQSLSGKSLSKSEWDEHMKLSMSLSEEDIAMHQIQGIQACNACENQMFDCSDSCDCAWGGSDIVQCMMCNSKCTAKKCAAYCAKIGQGGSRRLRGTQVDLNPPPFKRKAPPTHPSFFSPPGN